MCRRVLAQSQNYTITAEYEVVTLERTGSDIVIGDFYGDPEAAIIDAKERWCVVVGAGLVVYFLREPFFQYRYDQQTDQWCELFRIPPNTWFVNSVCQIAENVVRFVVNDGNEHSGAYDLTIGDYSLRKVQ